MMYDSILKAWIATREKGQGLVEYALILVLVSIVCIASLFFLNDQLDDVFNTISSTLQAGVN